ncbi:MAG: toprim domain-containing protein [Hydrogenoanaerobacterium sp.]
MAQNSIRDRGGNREVTQAIKAHFDILEYIGAYGYHFKEKSPGEFQCLEHDSMWVTPAKNLFIWNSQAKGGSVIDFVMLEDKLSLVEAISKLRSEMSGQAPTYTPKKYESFKDTEKKPFILPAPHQGKYSRVFAYLTKTRCISPAVVSDMVKRHFLYEDAKYHNCVFVGNDYDKKAKFACVRSTGEKKFGQDLEGSDKKIGWLVNENKPAVFLCEAPIDAMSIMTMLELAKKDYNKYSFLATSGNPKNEMLRYHLENNQKLKTIYFCYDNDTAGNNMAKKLADKCKEAGFNGQLIRKLPIKNDFNDDLKEHLAQQNGTKNSTLKNNKMEDITLCQMQR